MKRPALKIGWRLCRRLVQALTALFYLLVPVANSRGWRLVTGTLAAIRIGRLELLEPAAALGAVLAERRLTKRLLIGVMPLVVVALVLGPVFCSWICPWGLLSEGVHALRGRARRPAPAYSHKARRIMFVILAVLTLTTSTPWLAILSAPRLMTALPIETFYLKFVPAVTGGILLVLLASETFGPRRLWCRILCPVGTLLGELRIPWTLKVTAKTELCRCAAAVCHTHCSWGVDPRIMTSREGCTNCLACIELCPTGALSCGFKRVESAVSR